MSNIKGFAARHVDIWHFLLLTHIISVNITKIQRKALCVELLAISENATHTPY